MQSFWPGICLENSSSAYHACTAVIVSSWILCLLYLAGIVRIPLLSCNSIACLTMLSGTFSILLAFCRLHDFGMNVSTYILCFLPGSNCRLPSNTAILILDFAENYQYMIQDEVQSCHWPKEYCSLHPVSIYLRDNQGQLICKSICAISDDLKHDTIFVHEVMHIAVEHCKTHHPNITKFEYFSNGCAERYKNFKHI